MTYQFDTKDAEKYGVDEAIMLANMKFWVKKNYENEKHQYQDEEGILRTWSYNSVRAFANLFPFWGPGTIRRVLKNLIEKGAIVKGNFNATPYDRTLWYAISDKEICVSLKIDLLEPANRIVNTNEPIPDSKPDEKPYTKSLGEKSEPPQPKEMPTLKDSLAASYEEAFLNVQPVSSWGNIGRERGALKTLAKKTRILLNDTSFQEEGRLAATLLNVYQNMIDQGKSEFWKTAPFTPSGFLTRWTQVVTELSRWHDSKKRWEDATS